MAKNVAGARSASHERSRAVAARARARREQTLTPAERVFCLLLAIPTAVLAVGLWAQDVADPLDLSSLVIDRVLQVMAIVAVVGIVAVVLAPPRYALLGLAATFAFGVLLSVTLLLAGLLRPAARPEVMVLAGVGLLFSAVVMIRYVRRLGVPLARPWVAAVGFLAASLIPGIQLWSSTTFLPSRVEPNLTQELAVTPAPSPAGQIRATVTDHITNPTTKRVLVIISDMKVCSWSSTDDVIWETDTLRELANCTSSRPVTSRAWIPAGGSLHYSLAITVPASQPLVQVVSRIAFASGDRVRESIGTESRLSQLDRCSDVVMVQLQPESRYRGLAQRESYLVYADFDMDQGTNYFFSTGVPRACPARPVSELSRYLGVTEQRTVMTHWVTPPEQPAVPTGSLTALSSW